MDKYESIPLELPNEFIETSPGFTLDIGCSTAKLIYRSKEDYKNGKPTKDEVKGKTGRIFLIPSIARTELDDVIELIRTKCDIRQVDGGKKPEIRTTGAGCNLFQGRLESGLNVSLTNENEMECFANAFVHLSKHLKYDEIFYTTEDSIIAEVKKEEELVEKQIEVLIHTGLHKGTRATPEEIAAVVTERRPVLPCLIVMCGSGIGFMRVLEDGSFSLCECDASVYGGRSFLGLVSLLTGEKDFARIMAAVERGSCQSVDEYTTDLLLGGSDEAGGGDLYQKVAQFDRPIFPFGKAVTKSRDQISNDDILHSVYRSILFNLVDGARAQCLLNGIKSMYFCGNLIQNPNGRKFIETRNAVQNKYACKNDLIQVKFIKNGGHLGALGAFITKD